MNSGSRLRVLVVGCGAISDEHLPFLAGSELVDLVAVCDRSPTVGELARTHYGVQRCYLDASEALADVAPDVVHVLTSPRSHPELVAQSLAAGAHVICEKPLAPTAAATVELLDLADEHGRVLVESRNLLYNDVVREADRLIAGGGVGAVREVEVGLSLDLGAADVPPGGLGLPAGVMHDFLPHVAYLMLHFVGGRRVMTMSGRMSNLSGRPEIGFDHVDALIGFDGMRGRLRVSPDVVPHGLQVTIRGETGEIELDLYRAYLRHQSERWSGKLSPFGLGREGASLVVAGTRSLRDRLLQHGTYHGMPRMLEAFYEALASGGAVPIGRDEMIGSAELIDRLVELAEVR
jgi:predicted dehydrogenase